MQFDDIIKGIGEFGLYQKRLYALLVLPEMFAAMYTFMPVFIMDDDDNYRCHVGSELNSTLNGGHDVIITPLACSVLTTHVYNETYNTTKETSCSSWEYSKEKWSRTLVSDFDLVCDRNILKSHATMAYHGGIVLGAFLSGLFGDMFGRRPVILVAVSLLFIAALATAWSVNYTMYFICRFLTGAASFAYFDASVILSLEIVGVSKRVIVGTLIEVAFCVGEVILCGAAYFIRNWRTLQIVVAAPAAVLLSVWFFVQESPRWLLIIGRNQESIKVLNKMASVNKTRLPNVEIERLEEDVKGIKEIVHLFKSASVFFKWLAVVYLWFILATSFYGLAHNVGKLGGNVYLNFCVSAIVEMIGYSSVIWVSERFGRKKLNCVAFLTAGIICLSSIFPVLYSEKSMHWTLIAFSTIGKFAISAAFGNMFIYANELFPTTTRSSFLGSSHIAARSCSLVAPYIAYLSDLIDTRFGKALPLLVFGGMALSAACVSFFLPETFNRDLPDHMKDIIKSQRADKILIEEDKIHEQEIPLA